MVLPELWDCSTCNTGMFADTTLSQIFPAFDTEMFQSVKMRVVTLEVFMILILGYYGVISIFKIKQQMST